MKARQALLLILVLLAAAGYSMWQRLHAALPAGAPGAGTAAEAGRAVPEAGSGTAAGSGSQAGAGSARSGATRYGAAIGFRSRERLAEHFAKHGAEFGARSADDYLALAQRLRDAPAGVEILEASRGDGVITRFDRSSGAFLAFDDDGTIRTFFRPNQGESYFRRQLARSH